MATQEQQLFDAFQQVNRQIRRGLARSEAARGESEKAESSHSGVAPGQERVLQLLLRHGGSSQKDLASRLRIRPASLSEVLSRLEEKGLVIKEQDPADRRRNSYSLTAVGQGIAEQLKDQRRNQGATVFEVLSSEEKAQLAQILTKLDQRLLAERGEDNKDSGKKKVFGADS